MMKNWFLIICRSMFIISKSNYVVIVSAIKKAAIYKWYLIWTSNLQPPLSRWTNNTCKEWYYSYDIWWWRIGVWISVDQFLLHYEEVWMVQCTSYTRWHRSRQPDLVNQKIWLHAKTYVGTLLFSLAATIWRPNTNWLEHEMHYILYTCYDMSKDYK